MQKQEIAELLSLFAVHHLNCTGSRKRETELFFRVPEWGSRNAFQNLGFGRL